MTDSDQEATVRTRIRGAAGTTLRHSPPWVRAQLTRASSRLLAAMGTPYVPATEADQREIAAAARASAAAEAQPENIAEYRRQGAEAAHNDIAEEQRIAREAVLVRAAADFPLPDGLTLDEVMATFRSWSLNGEPVGHMDAYVTDSHLRFLRTWSLVRNDTGRCLELGANPYFTTWLLEQYTELELVLANYYGESGETRETLSWPRNPGASERVEVDHDCKLFNVEDGRGVSFRRMIPSTS